jgi:hypothetical protein
MSAFSASTRSIRPGRAVLRARRIALLPVLGGWDEDRRVTMSLLGDTGSDAFDARWLNERPKLGSARGGVGDRVWVITYFVASKFCQWLKMLKSGNAQKRSFENERSEPLLGTGGFG